MPIQIPETHEEKQKSLNKLLKLKGNSVTDNSKISDVTALRFPSEEEATHFYQEYYKKYHDKKLKNYNEDAKGNLGAGIKKGFVNVHNSDLEGIISRVDNKTQAEKVFNEKEAELSFESYYKGKKSPCITFNKNPEMAQKWWNTLLLAYPEYVNEKGETKGFNRNKKIQDNGTIVLSDNEFSSLAEKFDVIKAFKDPTFVAAAPKEEKKADKGPPTRPPTTAIKFDGNTQFGKSVNQIKKQEPVFKDFVMDEYLHMSISVILKDPKNQLNHNLYGEESKIAFQKIMDETKEKLNNLKDEEKSFTTGEAKVSKDGYVELEISPCRITKTPCRITKIIKEMREALRTTKGLELYVVNKVPHITLRRGTPGVDIPDEQYQALKKREADLTAYFKEKGPFSLEGAQFGAIDYSVQNNARLDESWPHASLKGAPAPIQPAPQEAIAESSPIKETKSNKESPVAVSQKPKEAGVEASFAEIESGVGTFSAYLTTAGHGQSIDFQNKPAQQFLEGLGVSRDEKAPLSKNKESAYLKQKNNPDVVIKSFDPKSQDELTITGARIDRLMKSAKTYVNTDIFSQGEYQKVINDKEMKAQTKGKSTSGIHLQNMAVGVCHVQEIDLLAQPKKTEDGKAILEARKGTIKEHDPALLLLSTPALNFAYGTAYNLTKQQQKEYIEGMYRNLFHATLSEGREYIALPAAGLGAFEGDPTLYFNTIMDVAKEFPKLNIIYNSGPPENAPIFDALLKEKKPSNVVRTDKDVMMLAHELTNNKKPCAFHNPSDADVVFGVYDVGEYWKNGKGRGYVGEEHIGAMSTAPLGSKLLNENAYSRVIEHGFSKKAQNVKQEQPVAAAEQKQSAKEVTPEVQDIKPHKADPFEKNIQELSTFVDNNFTSEQNKALKNNLEISGSWNILDNNSKTTFEIIDRSQDKRNKVPLPEGTYALALRHEGNKYQIEIAPNKTYTVYQLEQNNNKIQKVPIQDTKQLETIFGVCNRYCEDFKKKNESKEVQNVSQQPEQKQSPIQKTPPKKVTPEVQGSPVTVQEKPASLTQPLKNMGYHEAEIKQDVQSVKTSPAVSEEPPKPAVKQNQAQAISQNDAKKLLNIYEKDLNVMHDYFSNNPGLRSDKYFFKAILNSLDSIAHNKPFAPIGSNTGMSSMMLEDPQLALATGEEIGRFVEILKEKKIHLTEAAKLKELSITLSQLQLDHETELHKKNLIEKLYLRKNQQVGWSTLETDLNKASKLEIGKDQYSNLPAIANSDYQIELNENTLVVLNKKSKPYQQLEGAAKQRGIIEMGKQLQMNQQVELEEKIIGKIKSNPLTIKDVGNNLILNTPNHKIFYKESIEQGRMGHAGGKIIKEVQVYDKSNNELFGKEKQKAMNAIIEWTEIGQAQTAKEAPAQASNQTQIIAQNSYPKMSIPAQSQNFNSTSINWNSPLPSIQSSSEQNELLNQFKILFQQKEVPGFVKVLPDKNNNNNIILEFKSYEDAQQFSNELNKLKNKNETLNTIINNNTFYVTPSSTKAILNRVNLLYSAGNSNESKNQAQEIKNSNVLSSIQNSESLITKNNPPVVPQNTVAQFKQLKANLQKQKEQPYTDKFFEYHAIDKNKDFVTRTKTDRRWSLEQILKHALTDSSNRTSRICKQLDWLDENRAPHRDAPDIIKRTISKIIDDGMKPNNSSLKTDLMKAGWLDQNGQVRENISNNLKIKSQIDDQNLDTYKPHL